MPPPKVRPHLVWPLAYFSRTSTRPSPNFFKFQTANILQHASCVAVMLACLIFYRGPAIESLENFASNFFYRMRGVIAASTDVVIIEINDSSLLSVGSWPWKRSQIAKVVDILSQAGARTIVLHNLLQGPSTPEEDAALTESIKKSGRVYLPMVLDRRGYSPGWLGNLPEFEAAARGVAHVSHEADSDGVLRRIQPVIKHDKMAYEHLAFRVARDLNELVPPQLKNGYPLEMGSYYRINWIGPWLATFSRFSASDLFKAGSVPEQGRPTPYLNKLRGKICVVGATAYGVTSLVNTPYETEVPDLATTATILSNLLHREYVHRAGRALNLFCSVLIGLIACFFFEKLTRLPFLVAGLAVVPTWFWIASMVFKRWGILLDTAKPVLVVLSIFVYCTAYAMISAERERMRLLQIATRDGLTGLHAIFYFRVLLNEAVLQANREQKPLSLILIDIDHFKQINDTHGHPAGDAVLRKTAKVLRSFIRHRRPIGLRDEIGRYGGEEFIILLRECDLKDGMVHVAERIRKHVEKHKTLWEGKRIPVTVSLGIATLHPGETVPDVMVRRADEALYRAKNEGRNRTCAESPEPPDLDETP